ncbi:MAG: tetratricopeptide repeat protein [Nostoc sp.]
MSWENLPEILDGLEVLQTYSENGSAQNNRTGAVLGGGAALAAGVALGAASLPLAVPLLVASGVFAGAKGEETIKNAAKGIGFLFGEVAKDIGGVLDVFKSDEDFCYRGVERLQNGYYKEAIEDFTQAITINPKCIDAYFFRGCIRSDMGDYQGAISDYTQTIQR